MSDRFSLILNNQERRREAEVIADKLIADMGYQPFDMIPVSVVRHMIGAGILAGVATVAEAIESNKG